MKSFCAALYCGNKSGKCCKDISFFRFPKDEKRQANINTLLKSYLLYIYN